MDRRKKALTADFERPEFQLSPTKYIELPPGFMAFEKKIRPGVWYGAIQHVTGGREITYYSGRVQNAIREDNKDIVSERFRSTTYGTIKYAVENKNGKLRFLAEHNGVNFEAEIASNSEVDEILEIIKIVRSGTSRPIADVTDENRPTLKRRN